MSHRPLKNVVQRFFYLPQSERFSVVFVILVACLALASLIADWVTHDTYYMFQRSGALLVLGGVELQYAKLTSTWKKQLDAEISKQPSVEQRISSGQGISMRDEAKSAERVRNLAVLLYELVAKKNAKDVWAVVCIIVGTIIWAYGDIPFRG
jgi:hypothetical protein